MADLGKVKTEFETAARSFETDLKSQAAEVEREVRDAQSAIEHSLQPPSAAGTIGPAADVAAESSGAQSPQMELGIEAPPLPPKGPGEQ